MPIKNGNVIQCKTGTLARTDTTAKQLFKLPPRAMIVGIRAFGTNSNAATSATITVENRPFDGTGTAATVGTINGKATAAGATQATLAGIGYTAPAVPQIIQAKYAEAGTASTAGGDWTIVIEYI